MKKTDIIMLCIILPILVLSLWASLTGDYIDKSHTDETYAYILYPNDIEIINTTKK